MANYRFKIAEIEAMKQNILTHIEHETEKKTAWRLRCAIEGQLMCCRPSKRDAARLERELALYEKLTKNDLPNWQSEPTQAATSTETPRISTETAETVNVSDERGKGAERAEHNESAKLLTVIKRHEWGATPILFAYDPDKHIASATFKSISGDISVVNAKCDNDGYCHVYDSCMTIEELAWENMHAHNFIEPPQPSEAPQTRDCATDTPKPREMARKRQNRGIVRASATRHSGLGAGGYAMLDNASATLTAMHVPRECSTTAYW